MLPPLLVLDGRVCDGRERGGLDARTREMIGACSKGSEHGHRVESQAGTEQSNVTILQSAEHYDTSAENRRPW